MFYLWTYGQSGYFQGEFEEQTEVHKHKRNDQRGKPEESLFFFHLSPKDKH